MSPEPETSQTEAMVETEDSSVVIDVGKKEPGWEAIVRERGYNPDDGYIDLEGDGHYHWRLYPKDPDARRRIEEEREGWIH